MQYKEKEILGSWKALKVFSLWNLNTDYLLWKCDKFAHEVNYTQQQQSKGSVSQLMDDLDLIIEQVEVITVNSIQKGVENVLRKQCRLKTLLLL